MCGKCEQDVGTCEYWIIPRLPPLISLSGHLSTDSRSIAYLWIPMTRSKIGEYDCNNTDNMCDLDQGQLFSKPLHTCFFIEIDLKSAPRSCSVRQHFFCVSLVMRYNIENSILMHIHILPYVFPIICMYVCRYIFQIWVEECISNGNLLAAYPRRKWALAINQHHSLQLIGNCNKRYWSHDDIKYRIFMRLNTQESLSK